MGKYNHHCKVCGKGYNACNNCMNRKEYAPWRTIACSQEHFQAYMVLFEYGNGTLNRADAKQMLSGIDLDGWENYAEHNRVVIAEILQEEEARSVAEQPSVEEPVRAAGIPLVMAPLAINLPPVEPVAPEPMTETVASEYLVLEPVKVAPTEVRETHKQPWKNAPHGYKQGQQKSYDKFDKKNRK